MTPEELLAHLCEKSPRQKTSLEAIYAVCKDIVESGGTDFSYAGIARLGAERKVPKAQSIANKTGENYQALIKCFVSVPSTRRREPRLRGGDAWANEIKDPQLRILVQRSLAELAEAQRTIKAIVPPGTVIRVDDRSGTAPDFKLSAIERRAMEYLRSDDFLHDWKLERGRVGDILDPEKKTVFKPGTMQAIEKVLKYL